MGSTVNSLRAIDQGLAQFLSLVTILRQMLTLIMMQPPMLPQMLVLTRTLILPRILVLTRTLILPRMLVLTRMLVLKLTLPRILMLPRILKLILILILPPMLTLVLIRMLIPILLQIRLSLLQMSNLALTKSQTRPRTKTLHLCRDIVMQPVLTPLVFQRKLY